MPVGGHVQVRNDLHQRVCYCRSNSYHLHIQRLDYVMGYSERSRSHDHDVQALIGSRMLSAYVIISNLAARVLLNIVKDLSILHSESM